MKSIAGGETGILKIFTRNLCKILRNRCKANEHETEEIKVYFSYEKVEIRDSLSQIYNLPGYYFALVKYLEYPRAKMYLFPLMTGKAYLPTLHQELLWDKYGLVSPTDFEQKISRLPVSLDGAFIFDEKSAFQEAAGKLTSPCPYVKN